MLQQRLTRRGFLTLSTTVAGATLMAACVPTAPAAPAGAAESAAPAAPLEIDFMHIHGGKPGEVVNAIVDGFNASQGNVRVTASFIEGSYEGILERLQALIAAQKPPAVSQAGFQYTLFMQENMPITSVQSYVERDQFPLDDFYPSMIALGRSVDGSEQVAIPFAVSTPILYMNTEMFNAAGLDVTNPPQTWDEVRTAATAMTADENKGIYYYYGITGNWLVQAMVECAGGRLLGEDGKTITFNQEPGVRAMAFWNDLVQSGLMPLLTVEQAQQSFVAGTIGMWVSTTASLTSLRTDAKFDLVTALFPTDGQHERRVPGGGNNLFLLAPSDETKDAGWEFIKFTASPENASAVAQGMGYMVTRLSAKDTPELMGDFLAENPSAAVTYEQLPNMVRWTNFPGNSGTRIHKILQDNIQAMFVGQKSPEQALNDAATEGQALLG